MFSPVASLATMVHTAKPPRGLHIQTGYVFPNPNLGFTGTTSADGTSVFSGTYAAINSGVFTVTEVPGTAYLGSRTLTVNSGTDAWAYGNWSFGGSTSSSTVGTTSGFHPYKAFFKPANLSFSFTYWATDVSNAGSGQVYSMNGTSHPYPTTNAIKTQTIHTGGTSYGEFVQWKCPKPICVTALRTVCRTSFSTRQANSCTLYYSTDDAATPWQQLQCDAITIQNQEDSGTISLTNLTPAYAKLWRLVIHSNHGAAAVQLALIEVTCNVITNG